MLLLTVGMFLFFLVHLIPTFVDFRQRLIAWKGEAIYKIAYSCVALAGLFLIINGDLASILPFSGFGAFALFDMWSSNRRGAKKSDKKLPLNRDIMLIGAGLILFSVLLNLHPYLFGVAAFP